MSLTLPRRAPLPLHPLCCTGFLFLCYLQHLVGGPASFDPFIKVYVQKFAGGNVTTEEFRACFEEYFAEGGAGAAGVPAESDVKGIDWETWTKTPGMPLHEVSFDRTMRQAADDVADQWAKEGPECTLTADSISGFSTSQVIALLDNMLMKQSAGLDEGVFCRHTVDHLSKVYGWGASKNAEIRFRWQTLAIRAGYATVLPQVLEFLQEQGRMKVRQSIKTVYSRTDLFLVGLLLVSMLETNLLYAYADDSTLPAPLPSCVAVFQFTRPLYRDLYKSAFGRAAALKLFQEKHTMYHPICEKMVAADLGVTL